MPVYYDKSRKRWRYEFSRVIEGQRQRATKLLPAGWSAKEAEAYGQAQDSKQYALATGALREQPLISAAVLAYLTKHAPKLKNFEKLQRDLALCEPWFRGRRMTELAAVVDAYRQDNQGLMPATVKNRMAYLRAACRWAWKVEGMGDHDPAERVVMPSVRNERHVYLSRADVLRACRHTYHWWTRACMLVAFYSGMRLSETLRAEVTDAGWLLADTKNGSRRVIPIHDKVAYLARQWPPQTSARAVQQNAKKALEAAGLSGVRFHDLRHSAASAMINANVDLYTVGSVLGHKSPQSTKRYAHLSVESLAAAVKKIG
jgi:integrase